MTDAARILKRLVWKALFNFAPLLYEHFKSGGRLSCYPAVFDATRTIFIHVPKAAGCSVVSAFYREQFVNHRSWRYYRGTNRSKFDDYFKFAVVREPLDRFASAFDYVKAGGCGPVDECFAQTVLKPFSTANELAHALQDPLTRDQVLFRRPYFLPQAWFIADDAGRSKMNRLLRFEHLAEDLQRLADELGRNKLLLRRLNKTPGRSPVAFDSQTIAVLNRIYREDFPLWRAAGGFAKRATAACNPSLAGMLKASPFL
jgi:hypothetical protein